MDDGTPLGIEYRVVKDAEHQGQAVRVVSGSRTYEAGIEELWDAVTNPKRIPNWFAPISGELKLGGRYQLEGNAGGKITRCDTPNAVDLTWEFQGNTSWVTIRLEPDEDGTRLTLEHLIGQDEASEKHWKKYGPGATGVGWELGFLALGRYLKKGAPIAESESNAWLESSAGKVFMKKCAKEWGEAHALAGEDVANADSAANATAAFYCGESHDPTK